MTLLELYDMDNREEESKYIDIQKDNTIPKLDDLRKTKLTLSDINRMRKVRDIRSIELEEDRQRIYRQFSQK